MALHFAETPARERETNRSLAQLLREVIASGTQICSGLTDVLKDEP